MRTSNSKPTASAHPMSWFDPRIVCHPGVSFQACHRWPTMIPIPIPELASEKARWSVNSEGGLMGRCTLPLSRCSVHHSKSPAIILTGQCGMKGRLEHRPSMRLSPVRYARPRGSTEAV